MDSGTILSIVGIIISVVFGAWGLYVTILPRPAGRIAFVNEKAIDLFHDVANSVRDLSLKYQGEPVKKNLVLLNAALVNTGRSDIAPSDVEMPITASVPPNYRLLWVKIWATSPNLNAQIEIRGETAAFIFGLLRSNEFARVHLLAEVPMEQATQAVSPTAALFKALAFSHRIKNVREVEIVEIEQFSGKRIRRTTTMLCSMFVLGMLAAAGLQWLPFSSLGYNYVVDKENEVVTRVYADGFGE